MFTRLHNGRQARHPATPVPGALRLFAIMIVRDEADIILDSIGHLLCHLQVARVLVADNGSSDRTPWLLDRIARTDARLDWHRRPGRFDQAGIMSDLAQHAWRLGADWVLPADADEFFHPGASGMGVLAGADGVGAFSAPVRNFVQHRLLRRLLAGGNPASALRSMVLSADPVGDKLAARGLVESRRIPFVSMRYPPKLLFRAADGIVLESGCHGAAGLNGIVRAWEGGAFLHAPIRNPVDMSRRVAHGARLQDSEPDPAIGWHVRRLLSLSAQALDGEWLANTAGPGRAGAAGCPLRMDTRLRRIHRSLRHFRAQILHPPAAPEPEPQGSAPATATGALAGAAAGSGSLPAQHATPPTAPGRRRRQAVLFRAHRATPGARACLARLVAEAGPDLDIWLVGLCSGADGLADFGHTRTRAYTPAMLGGLPYAAKLAATDWGRVVGHHDLTVLQFFHERPGYGRYWIVEYDVRFTGHWGALLADLAQRPADLLGTTIQRRVDNPAWANWCSVITGDEAVADAHWIKSFMPFGAVSPALLDAVDRRYRRGWSGHCEATWPMIASLERLGIEDIGGAGAFVPAGREGRYYWNTPMDPHLRPGSFVFRPVVAAGQDDQAWTGTDLVTLAWQDTQLRTAGQLVHPVKD